MHHKVVGNFGSEADVRSLYFRGFRFNETFDNGRMYSRSTGEVNSNRVTSSLLRKRTRLPTHAHEVRALTFEVTDNFGSNVVLPCGAYGPWTGHNRLNYHLYSKLRIGHTEQCPCGTGSQTTEHLLQSCPIYEPLRKGIWPDHTPVARKLCGSLRDLRCTATFIEETGVSI